MPEFVKRFLNFDRLIATSLIKILYWVGLIGILIFVVVAMISGLIGMTQDFMTGFAAFIGAPLFGGLFLLFWRFAMEVYIVIFSIHDRLGEIRDKIGS
jgi:hypothetical protein